MPGAHRQPGLRYAVPGTLASATRPEWTLVSPEPWCPRNREPLAPSFTRGEGRVRAR
jgi:hypothetical protein